MIERDQGIGNEARLKAIDAFDPFELVPDSDDRPSESSGREAVIKSAIVSELPECSAHEKVEALGFVADDLWGILDSAGGRLRTAA